MKLKTIIILLIIASVLYLGGHYIYYGSLTRNCIYTENKIPVPEQLAKGEIVVAKDAYLAVGVDRDYSCLKNLGSISNEIVSPESINNITVGRHYFTGRGLAVKSLKKGATFKVVDVVEVAMHGISNIEGGSNIDYLILQDQNNVLYKIATVFLGINKGDEFLSFVDSSSSISSDPIKLLNDDSFGMNPFTYTGKLVELSEAYLEGTEPQWKKLADRLERGEKFTIMVTIELYDDSFKEIKLSDNQEDRYRQVAQVQDEFLKKIPSNLVLNGIEKNKAWPYVSMDANLDLLNYLVDEQAKLKIESISELMK